MKCPDCRTDHVVAHLHGPDCVFSGYNHEEILIGVAYTVNYVWYVEWNSVKYPVFHGGINDFHPILHRGWRENSRVAYVVIDGMAIVKKIL